MENKIVIKKKSNENMVYMQIVNNIKRSIVSDRIQPGAKFMSIEKFAKELGVAENTVGMAYKKLVREGLISAKRGVGYTVTNNKSIIEAEREKLINKSTLKYAETLKECLPVVELNKRERGIRESDVDKLLVRIKEIVFRKASEND